MASCMTAESNLSPYGKFTHVPTQNQISQIYFSSKYQKENKKVLDFDELERDILKNVFNEVEVQDMKLHEPIGIEEPVELNSFPSFNYVPTPIPSIFTKLNPILKIYKMMQESYDAKQREIETSGSMGSSQTDQFVSIDDFPRPFDPSPLEVYISTLQKCQISSSKLSDIDMNSGIARNSGNKETFAKGCTDGTVLTSQKLSKKTFAQILRSCK